MAGRLSDGRPRNSGNVNSTRVPARPSGRSSSQSRARRAPRPAAGRCQGQSRARDPQFANVPGTVEGFRDERPFRGRDANALVIDGDRQPLPVDPPSFALRSRANVNFSPMRGRLSSPRIRMR